MICKQCGCSTRMSDANFKHFDPETEFVYCNKCYKEIKKNIVKLLEVY